MLTGSVEGYGLPLMSRYAGWKLRMSKVAGAALRAGSISLSTTTASSSYAVVG